MQCMQKILQGKTKQKKMMKVDGSIKVVMCDHQAVVLRNFVVEIDIF